MDSMPPIPNFLQRQPTGQPMTTAPEKKTRQPRMTPLQKSRFYLQAEIALINKKLEGVAALQARKDQLQQSLDAMPSE
jgi:acyl carrier protein phosphodiesterase